ncbi:MAG: glycine cleavage system protein GcvH [Candidatus Marinimicrobia bacterium]|nr:glycine cleavage system protein GcvH [Candidatus Neomarinimicrobiota bacterium]
MTIPEKLLYTKEHEWVKKEDEQVTIGITDFAQSQLGDIIFLELPEVGQKIVSGEPFGEIEAVKTVSELYAPINGTVIEINEDLEDDPDNINQDCYGSGWIIKVELDGALDKDNLLNHKDYGSMIA